MPDDRGLGRLTDSGSVTRGVDYARRGRARILATDGPGTVKGLVRGSGGVLYETDVNFELDSLGNVSRFDGWCSCPVGDDCKHAVALLLTELTARNATRVPAPARLTAVPDDAPVRDEAPWEALLSGIAGSDTSGSAVTAPLALAFELVPPVAPRKPGDVNRWSAPRTTGSTEGRLSVRPVCQGTQGKWIRTGVSWTDLAHGYARWKFREDHVRILSAIARLNAGDNRYAYSGTDPWIQLPTITSPTIFDLLTEAVAAGLALITLDAGQPTVSLSSDAAEITVDVGREPGGLVVAPAFRLNGIPIEPRTSVFLGDPAHSVASWALDPRGRPTGLTLARLDHRVDRPLRALHSQGGAHIPAYDEAKFLDEYLPALRRQHSVRAVDSSVTLPEDLPPALAVTVRPLPGHQIELRWSWLYRAGRKVRRLPLGFAGVDDGARDPGYEGQLVERVVPLVAHLPQLVTTTAGRPAPSAVAVLVGRDSIDFVERVLPLLRALDGVEISVDGTLPDYRQTTDEPVITLASTPADGSRDWFDLSVTITVGADDIPFEPLFVALATGDEVMILDDGSYFELDRPEFRKLRALIEEAQQLQDRPDGPLQISRFQAGLWDELQRLGVVDAQSAEWLDRVNSWRYDPDIAQCEPPAGLAAELRPYQRTGFQWLNLLREHGLGGVLADDMGLGKTVQTLAMIVRAREQTPSDPPFLVVAPTSVVGNWHSEAAKFAPGLRAVMITGTETRRGVPLSDIVAGADLVITSYTLFRLEFDGYEQLPFSGLILDEAQVVKNHQSKAFACAKRLPAPVKFAITGTPMENNLMELWALFSLVAPGLFPNPVTFSDQYRIPIERGTDQDALPRLRRRIAPLLLRRTKEQVAADLPAKQEQILELELEPGHRKIYQRQLQRERQKILGLISDMDKNRFAIFRSLMLLRQASIDPFLVDPANIKVPSTKLTVLMELLEDVIAEGHRTLIFSQFTGFLARVRSRLDEAGIAYNYLDGSTRDRPKVLDEFRTGTAPVFLISLKAGGVGLNLTEADYCILLDPWWNPAAEAQAVDRTHRIGQTKKVMVYRLVSKDTIEEKVMALKDAKARLFAGVMSGADDGAATETASSVGKGITASDIRALLA